MLVVSSDGSQTFTAYFWRPVLLGVFLCSLMLLTSLLTKRMPGSVQEAKRLGVCSWLIIGTLFNSLVYELICAIVLFGVGASKSSGVSGRSLARSPCRRRSRPADAVGRRSRRSATSSSGITSSPTREPRFSSPFFSSSVRDWCACRSSHD